MSSAWITAPDDAPHGSAMHIPGIGWSEVVRIWLRASWLIIPIALLGAGAGFALSHAMQPVYEADAVLLLDRPSPGQLGTPADSRPADAQQRAAVVRSQIEILRGNDVVTAVIDQLKLGGEPMFNPQPDLTSRLRARVTSLLGLAAGPNATPASGSPEAHLIRAYLDHLTVRQDAETYILHVGFRAPDAGLAERIVNTHIAKYTEWLRRQQSQATDGAQAWLVSAVETAHKRVLTAEAAVQELNKSGVLLNMEGRTSLDQGLSQLTSDLAVAQATLVKSEARADELRRLQKLGQVSGIAAMSGSKTLADLETAYAKSSADSAAMQASSGSRYPALVQSQARDSEIKVAIAREIDHIIAGEVSQANIARVTVGNLTTALDQMKQKVVVAEGDRSKLTRLEGEAAAERSIYLSLLQKLRSYDGVDQLAKADVTVLASAVAPDVPRSPQRGLFAAFGFLLAGATAAGASVWRVNRRDVVRHSSDAMTLTGVRCLGVMPELKLKSAGGIDRQQLNYGFFREELRSVCAALVRDHAGKRPGGVSVLITSSLPGEGKSSFSYELGLFAAQSGVKTLIVRADQPAASRRNTVHEAKIGVLDDNLPLYAVDWVAPATMLGGHDLERSLDKWRRDFGLVIFDTPPLSAMAESVILAPVVDATFVLVRVDRTPRSLLASVTQQIEKAGGNLAGVIVTFARLDTQHGVMPSDLGYYFRRNRAYHRQLAATREAERA